MPLTPVCLVQDGIPPFVPTTNGVDVSPGNTISIKLLDPSSVVDWFLEVIGTDELSTSPALTDVNPLTHKVLTPATTVTFSFPGASGRAVGFKSTVTGVGGPLEISFGIYSLTAFSTRVGFVTETREGNTDFGWASKLNPLIRIGGSGGGGGSGTIELIDGSDASIPTLQKMLHSEDLMIADGDLGISGHLQQIDTDRNYSEKIVPFRTKRVIPTRQQMVYSGTLRVDGTLVVDGVITDVTPSPAPESLQSALDNYLPINTLVGRLAGASQPITPSQGRSLLNVYSIPQVDALVSAGGVNFNTFWDVSSNNDGTFTGSDSTHVASFTAVVNRINKWDGASGGIVATLPAGDPALHNRVIAFFEANSNSSNALTLSAPGASRIRFTGTGTLGTAAVDVRGDNSYLVLRYDASSDTWVVVEGQYHALGNGTVDAQIVSTVNGNLTLSTVNTSSVVGNVSGSIGSIPLNDDELLGRTATLGVASIPAATVRRVLNRWGGSALASATLASTPQHDVTPTGWSTASHAELTSTVSEVHITGFDSTGVDTLDSSAIKFIRNASTSNRLILDRENVGSSANNRIATPNFVDFVIPPGQTAMLWWDSTLSRWRVMETDDGTALVTQRNGTIVTSGPFVATAGERVLFDPSAGTFTISASANTRFIGQVFAVKNVAINGTPITVSGNGVNIEDPVTRTLVSSFLFSGILASAEWVWNGTSWVLTATSLEPEGLLVTNGGVSSLLEGMAVYISAANSVNRAQANAVATAQVMAIVRNAQIATGAQGRVQYAGRVAIPAARQDGIWTFGQKIYLSPTTAGNLTNTAPTTSGQFVVPLGRCLNTPAGSDAILLISFGEVVEIV